MVLLPPSYIHINVCYGCVHMHIDTVSMQTFMQLHAAVSLIIFGVHHCFKYTSVVAHSCISLSLALLLFCL